jgi:hypothetical protein
MLRAAKEFDLVAFRRSSSYSMYVVCNFATSLTLLITLCGECVNNKLL